jgi:hypothetical protein
MPICTKKDIDEFVKNASIYTRKTVGKMFLTYVSNMSLSKVSPYYHELYQSA